MDFLSPNLATERPMTHLRSSSKIKTVLSTCTVIDGAGTTPTSIVKGCLQLSWKPCSLLCVYSIRKSRIKSNLSANKERAMILFSSLELCSKIDRIRVLVAGFLLHFVAKSVMQCSKRSFRLASCDMRSLEWSFTNYWSRRILAEVYGAESRSCSSDVRLAVSTF